MLLVVILSISMIRQATMIATHLKCRGGLYPRSNVQRHFVPDDKVNWSVEFKEYDPPNYTSPGIHGKPWADPVIGKYPVPTYIIFLLSMFIIYQFSNVYYLPIQRYNLT